MDINTISGMTGCFAKAGLTIGTTPEQVRINAPNGAGVDFALNGKAYHKADIASVALTAQANQAPSTTCLYLVCLSAAGAVSSVKGEEVANADVPVIGVQYPDVPVNVCPIGAIKVTTSATAGGYTMGTTSLAAANVTDNYIDFMGGVPSRPEITVAT